VELLASIAIVAALTAIAMTAAKNVLQSGNATKCMSNMRQIGVAMNAYLADHDNTYPPVVMNSVSWKYWDMDAIWEYAMGIPSTGNVNYYTNYKTFIFCCPSSDKTKNCSYAFNAMFPDGVKNYYNPRRRAAITKPAACLLLGEGTNHALDSWWNYSVGQPMTFPHGGRQNLLFADLHAESRGRSDIPQGGFGTPETANSFWTGN